MDGPGFGAHMSGGGLILMILGVIALLGMLTIGIILLVHYLRRPAQPPGQTDSRLTPAQVLAERFTSSGSAFSMTDSRDLARTSRPM